MKFNLCLLAFIFCFACNVAASAEMQYRNVEEFVASLPEKDGKLVIEGDLNNDRMPDKVVIHKRTETQPYTPDLEELQIFILLKKSNGSFYIAQTTKKATVKFTDKFSRGGSIENGSLYVEFEGVFHPSSARYQFKLYKGQWRLIGMTESATNPYRNIPGELASDGTDFNLLTGDIDYVTDEYTSQEKRTRKRITIRPCFFADFDFSEDFIDKHCKK